MEIVFTKQAIKDFEKVKQNPTILKKVVALLELLESNPYTNPPSYEKLIGINNTYSRRINSCLYCSGLSTPVITLIATNITRFL